MPHSYIDHCNVVFIDGSTQRITGNREEVRDGVLTILTRSTYGDARDVVRLPLSNIKSWSWESGS